MTFGSQQGSSINGSPMCKHACRGGDAVPHRGSQGSLGHLLQEGSLGLLILQGSHSCCSAEKAPGWQQLLHLCLWDAHLATSKDTHPLTLLPATCHHRMHGLGSGCIGRAAACCRQGPGPDSTSTTCIEWASSLPAPMRKTQNDTPGWHLRRLTDNVRGTG